MTNRANQPHAPLPTQAAPRCGAKTRKGTPCKGPRVRRPDGSYRPRCRMHGCGPGSGAPRGNQNAVKNGFYTAEARQHRRELRDLLNDCQTFLQQEKR